MVRDAGRIGPKYALAACALEFGVEKGSLITWDVDRHETVSGIAIRFIPLWKWLLEPDAPVAMPAA